MSELAVYSMHVSAITCVHVSRDNAGVVAVPKLDRDRPPPKWRVSTMIVETSKRVQPHAYACNTTGSR